MDDRALIRTFEGIQNKRFLAFAAVALLAFSVVVIGVIAGFRGNHVSKSADAMTLVHSPQPRTPPSPPPAP